MCMKLGREWFVCDTNHSLQVSHMMLLMLWSVLQRAKHAVKGLGLV